MRYPIMALLAAALVPSARAQDFTWSGRLSAGATLEVRGVNGAIEAVPASGAARVTARKTAQRSDPSEVDIVTVPHDGGVLICAIYPGNDPDDVCRPGGGGEHRVRNNDVTVDFRVEVPADVRLVARTVNGTVNVRDVGADVMAYAVNGNVEVSTAGAVEASTVNGSIHARVGDTAWDGTLSFRTVNGGITLELPANLATRIEAETVNGAIESDFPITIRGRFGPRTATGTIGDGGDRLLELRTVNGSIRLRRS